MEIVECEHARRGNHLRQPVLVSVADLLENRCGGLGCWRLAVHHGEQAKLVLYDVGNGLCVGGGTGAAAPDCVVHPGQFVSYAVRDVCASCCAGVGACVVMRSVSRPR